MSTYVLNRQEYDGHHEVHNADTHSDKCTYPRPENQIDLGEQPNCSQAVLVASLRHTAWDIDGCGHCTNCHTK